MQYACHPAVLSHGAAGVWRAGRGRGGGALLHSPVWESYL